MLNKKHPLFLVVLLLFLFSLRLNSFTADIESNINLGTEMLLNLDFNGAKKHFRLVLKAKPEHPVGFFYLGLATFVAHINTSISVNTLKEFKSLTDQGLYYASRLENPTPEDKLFIIGMKALKAFASYNDGDYAAAIFGAFNVIKDAQELYKKYPKIYDIQLVLGIYNMFSAVIPDYVKKVFTILTNLKGSKKNAFTHFDNVIKKGKYFKWPTVSILCYFYTFYLKNQGKARELYAKLINRFPKNFFFRLNLTYTYFLEKKYSKALRLIKIDKSYFADKLKTSLKKWAYRFDFLEARILFKLKEYDRALALFKSVIKERKKNWQKDFYCVYSILYRAMIYDAINKRERALRSYKFLTEYLDQRFIKAKLEAEKYIKKAYKPKN
jgi:tetratricopeptide (TPR) repeat protein